MLLDEELSIVIIGDGEEKDNVLNGIRLLNSMGKLDITYIDWVDNAKLSSYLNEIKLLVIPSYKEGLPNIVLESMSCGCVVSATPVGGIPDVIKDGETGFIMENNNPECVAENVIRALNHADLDRIVKNARLLVEKEYTYEAAVERYRKILENLGVKNHE
jgi:glycosyltransferase involved in cell wall biosynthesis